MRRVYLSQGFTLIELLVTISVISILMGIGIYGLREAFIKSAIREQAMSVDNILKTARTAARIRQETVTVNLPLNVNLATYRAFVDTNGNVAYDSGDVLISQDSLSSNVIISGATYTVFTYTPLGAVMTGNQIILKRQDGAVPNQYKITIASTGMDQVHISTDSGTSWQRAW